MEGSRERKKDIWGKRRFSPGLTNSAHQLLTSLIGFREKQMETKNGNGEGNEKENCTGLGKP